MGTVLIKAAIFLCMILLGILLRRIGFFKKEDFSLIAKIVINITLPCAVITNFAGMELDFSLLILSAFGFGCNLLLMGAGVLAARGKSRLDRAYNIVNYTGFNIGCFSMPYIQSFLGASGAVAACLFDAGNAVVCTGGSYAFASVMLGKGNRSPVAAFFKKLFRSIPLDTYLLMLLLAALGWKLPAPVVDFAGIVGGGNAFLAMLMIGVGFEIHLDRSRLRSLLLHLAVRFSICGLLALLCYFAVPLPLEVRQLLCILLFSPIASASPAFTGMLGGDAELASTANSISIVIGITVMTALILLMGIAG